MYTLPHTSMRVPTLEVYLTGIEHGLAWSATLRFASSSLGQVRHERGRTYVTPPHHQARERLRTYLAQCQGPSGEPLSEEDVLDNLFAEQAWAAEVERAERKSAFAVKIDLADGTDRARLPRFPDIAPPQYEEAASRIVWDDLPEQAVSASLWMGPAHGWVEHYRAPCA